eukprot:COSAG05_NODE_153_length_15894_cov_27.910415_8_plen_169_part_00
MRLPSRAELTLSLFAAVTVTNSNKGAKGTQYAIHFARFGAITFTDVEGGGHMLADQDELDQQRKMKDQAVNSEKAKQIRQNLKKAEAAKKQLKTKKLPRAGKRTGIGGGGGDGAGDERSADEDDTGAGSDEEEWTCFVCNTKGAVSFCSTIHSSSRLRACHNKVSSWL